MSLVNQTMKIKEIGKENSLYSKKSCYALTVIKKSCNTCTNNYKKTFFFKLRLHAFVAQVYYACVLYLDFRIILQIYVYLYSSMGSEEEENKFE